MNYSELKPGDIYEEDDRLFLVISSPIERKVPHADADDHMIWLCLTSDGDVFEDSVYKDADAFHRVKLIGSHRDINS